MFFPVIDRECGGLFEIPNGTGTPERRLLAAIIERAILDYVGNDPKEVQAAGEWIFENFGEPPHGEFSFPWICQELDLNLEKVLSDIKKMPKRGSRKIAPWYFVKQDLAQAG